MLPVSISFTLVLLHSELYYILFIFIVKVIYSNINIKEDI